MKKHLKVILIFLVGIVLFSCSKNDDTKTVPIEEPAFTEFINLKCNNVQYNFTNPEIINSLSKTLLAFTTNEKRISIFLPLNVVPGSYTITDSSNPNAYSLSLNINAINLDAFATSGSVKITSVTTNSIKGTFSCSFPTTSGQTFTVTDGSFNVGN